MLALPIAKLPLIQTGQNSTVGGSETGACVMGDSAGASVGTLGQPQTFPAAAAACAIAHCVFVTPLKTNAWACKHVIIVPGNGPSVAMIPPGFCNSKPPSRHKLQLISGCIVGNGVGTGVGATVGTGVGCGVGRTVGTTVGAAVVGAGVGSVRKGGEKRKNNKIRKKKS
jgi:hypothetical protein